MSIIETPAIHRLDEAGMAELVTERGIVLLAFVSSGDAPCQRFETAFEDVAARNTDLCFGRVDVDEIPELAAAFGVSKVPTFIAVREQILVLRRSDALAEASLYRLVEQVRLLDMDDIRTEIAANEGDEDAIDW